MYSRPSPRNPGPLIPRFSPGAARFSPSAAALQHEKGAVSGHSHCGVLCRKFTRARAGGGNLTRGQDKARDRQRSGAGASGPIVPLHPQGLGVLNTSLRPRPQGLSLPSPGGIRGALAPPRRLLSHLRGPRPVESPDQLGDEFLGRDCLKMPLALLRARCKLAGRGIRAWRRFSPVFQGSC